MNQEPLVVRFDLNNIWDKKIYELVCEVQKVRRPEIIDEITLYAYAQVKRDDKK